MSDVDEVKKRISSRKHHNKPLNDHHFRVFYNAMIRFMVVILVVVTSLIVVKNHNVQDYILNNELINTTITSISQAVLDYLPDNDQSVSHQVVYQKVKDNYYKSDGNTITSLGNGKVIYCGKNDETLGNYITILDENEVEITYAMLDDIDVKKFDEVTEGMKIASYQKQFILTFDYLGKSISYETYQGME